MGIQVQTSTVTGAGKEISQPSTAAVSSKSPTGSDALDQLKGDTVSLSGVSNLIRLASNENPADREARIASLTAQVQAGQYRPNLTEVSRAMIQDLMAG
ncbi:MAG: flagellar biosynthesis anti-sigma factor FlgM [Acidobacteriaceae bacterium]|nr:flagellar biosynthesis anti-sigma factor FlgM [Acidobacteriaceae bacterium]